MTMSGLKAPNNKILVAGTPLIQELNVENATNMYPGRLVKKGTNDNDVTVSGAAGICFGWLGYEQCTNAGFMPTDKTTNYAANAQAPVLYGGGFVVLGKLAANQTVVKGDRLVAAADGMVSKAAPAVTKDGSTQVTSSAAKEAPISGTVPEGGIVVGIAMESVTTTTAAADIMVLSLI
jgi:hypothetical protein